MKKHLVSLYPLHPLLRGIRTENKNKDRHRSAERNKTSNAWKVNVWD